jgi:fructose-specific component phosphotransferase system IIB-like protein
MSSGTSYNGWPADSDKAAIGVVSNALFPGGVKSGDVAIVLSYVMRQLNARVEPIVDGWNWGYTYKANVNNPSQLSCHASGTAGDFNAVAHPNGSSGTFTDAQRGEIYQILDEVQGSVSWLEGYDEMHFEICVNASDLAYVAAILGDAAPPTPPQETDWFDMATEDDLRRIVGEELDNRLATIGTAVWTTQIRANDNANTLLAAATDNATWAAQGVAELQAG